MSHENSPGLQWFRSTLLSDWLRKLTPTFQPFRTRLGYPRFPAFKWLTRTVSEFLLVPCENSLHFALVIVPPTPISDAWYFSNFILMLNFFSEFNSLRDQPGDSFYVR